MKVAVIGAGNGGCATAIDMMLRGIDVTLCSAYYPAHLKDILKMGGIEYSGIFGDGFLKIKVTTSIKDAIEPVDIIIITVPSTMHEFYGSLIAPYLQNNHIIFLNGCTVGGALHIANILRKSGIHRPIVCETDILRYICRLQGTTHIKIYHQIKNLLFASFPAKYNNELYEIFKELYPGLVVVENVMVTSLSNLNAIIHPVGAILNAGWIEFTKGDFFFYSQGITKAVSHIIEQIDKERLNILKKMDLNQIGILEHLKRIGFLNTNKKSFYEAIQASEPVKLIKSPTRLNHRYLSEDIGYGLVPMAYIAKEIHVSTPAIESLINLACLLNQVNYWSVGLKADELGIKSFSIEKLKRFLFEGIL